MVPTPRGQPNRTRPEPCDSCTLGSLQKALTASMQPPAATERHYGIIRFWRGHLGD